MAQRSNPLRERRYSKAFQRLKAERVKATHSRCEGCGQYTPAQYMMLWHRTFERLGNEQPGDLELICRRCRDARIKAKRESR